MVMGLDLSKSACNYCWGLSPYDFMSFRGRVPDVLPFTKADLRLPMTVRKGQRNSISGVQAKVLLSIVDGEFAGKP